MALGERALMSDTSCIASSADRNARQADLPYYGKLENIIELNYYGEFRVVLFKCKWADTTRDRGFKRDVCNCFYLLQLYMICILQVLQNTGDASDSSHSDNR
ncbi:hypothetical protein RDI58_004924 [Solanum bulbocastanum]|uniref:DUF4216 domain-containing protein n=1 Tax=Solanum bulbocastanum TaxID=147425 RepID=A0AAN8U7I3_SOLBU